MNGLKLWRECFSTNGGGAINNCDFLERGYRLSRILITGAAGFLGRRLTSRILKLQGEGMEAGFGDIRSLILWDHLPFEAPVSDHLEVKMIHGDLLDEQLRNEAFAGGLDSIIHLAAVVSSQAEEDFDLGMRVNAAGTRALLEACRARENQPKFVMTSSVAVFGGDLPNKVPDQWALKPRSSYGAEKAICELMVGEYSRRGFVDGRVLRLPTIVVRPGRPNRAASSFASSIIREPLRGEPAVCPVAPETPMWLMSPDRAVDAFVHVYDLQSARLGDDRVISMPGLSVTAAEMVAALERVAGVDVAQRVEWQFDAAIADIVQSWPGDFEATRAKELGFQADADMDEIIAAHIAETANDEGSKV
jgi:D-erythronate 2-dehydrogenase